VFFLATKDKTSRILKSFITEIENLVEKKVRIIRCDNGTEFKNKVMNEFYAEKEWLFDIDALSKSMNYVPVPVGTNSIDFAALDGNNKDKHGPFQASESDDQEGPNTDSSTKTINTDRPVNTATPTYDDYPNDPLMPDLEDVGIFDDAYDDRDKGRSYAGRASPVQATECLDTGRFTSGKKSLRNQIEEVYVSQPPGFVDPEFLDRVYKVEKALYGLHQAPRACVKSASTPMETHKPLLKDAARTYVDVHLYRSMIGSLMYLTSFKPDIMFAVCACSRFQVQPKVSHMHVVKRILRYLKGQPTLGLWYPKDSPLKLIAYCDSDYLGSSLDRKSITGGCQFLGSRLISWQCKKQTIVAISTTKAEYIAASNCCGQVLWLQNQLLDYGYNFMQTKIHVDNERLKLNGYLINNGYAELVQHAAWISSTQEMVINSPCLTDKKELAIPGQTATGKELSNLLMIKTVNDNVRLQALINKKKVVITEASIRHDLKLNDAEGNLSLPNAMIFEELARMGAKTTSWKEFSSTMASAIICLANNQKFNFSKHILDNLKKNLEAGVPLYMFPRKHKPRRKEKKERKETEVSPTGLPIEDPLPTPSSDPLPSGEDSMPHKELMVLCTNLSNKFLDLENEVIEMKSFHQAKIAVESLAVKETIIDKEKSSKQGRKIADIDADAEVNLENVYNLELAYKESVLSMHDTTDADGKEFAEEMVEVITTAKIIVDEVSTGGGELNAAGEEPISVASTNITTAQPSEATKTTVNISTTPKAKGIVFHDMEELTTRTSSLKAHVKDKGNAKLVKELKVLKSRKAHIAIDEEVARRIEAEWNADMQDNIDWNETAKKQKGNELEKENAEKQNMEEQQEAEELKRNLEIIPDDEDDVFVNVAPLSSKPLTIVDYKIYKEGKKEHFQIIRANGNYQMYLAFSTMLKNFDTEDLEVLWKIVKDRFNKSQPKEVLDVFLWHTLKVMFEHSVEDSVWKL
nr:uncharacterized mitochondrial protein AtMg00810-like [Tanacetum cinerariifolium]